jgi:hypothetical protein
MPAISGHHRLFETGKKGRLLYAALLLVDVTCQTLYGPLNKQFVNINMISKEIYK